MRRIAILLLAMATTAPPFLRAQSMLAAQPVLRYHYGDNPAWADLGFNDGAWPTARDGSFPAPANESDGFFWVRARIAVPADVAGPLAIGSQTFDGSPHVQEVWVNGRLVGRYGDFPPHANPLIPPQILVFDIPADVAQPGSMAIVALRTWNEPVNWSESLVQRHPDPVKANFSIGSAPLLHVLAAESQDRAWLQFWPQFCINLLFIMMGLCVLALGVWARDRRLLLCALWLVTLPVFLVFRPLPSLLAGWRAPMLNTAFFVVNAIGMCVVVEFIWTVQEFRDRIFRSAAHLCWIGLTIGGVFSFNWMHPGALTSAGRLTLVWLLFAFNVITSGADLVALAGRGRNRPIAAAMLLISVSYFLGIAGNPARFDLLGIDFFATAFYLSTIFIAILLMWQTWTAWHKAEGLRIEFSAARKVQQRLVPDALPYIDRFRLEAAYIPAAEVGGDFYQVFPQIDGSALVVIGDVSGKGLKAAMTGALVIGALRNMAQDNLPPSQILNRLNAQLAASSDGGFVTCLAAHVASNGVLTLANAGHLSPYRNHEEVPVEPGLPLGVTGDVDYAESTFMLIHGETLTFLSDGVVEAQNAQGELFGFERTRSISSQPAEQIVAAAQQFGQQDDITVLTLTFTPAEASHA